MQISFAIDTETGLATATFAADQLQAVLDALSTPAKVATPRVYRVPSDRDRTLLYEAVYDPASGRWTCTCPDYKHRSPRIEPDQYVCKHIIRAQFMYAGEMRELVAH